MNVLRQVLTKLLEGCFDCHNCFPLWKGTVKAPGHTQSSSGNRTEKSKPSAAKTTLFQVCLSIQRARWEHQWLYSSKTVNALKLTLVDLPWAISLFQKYSLLLLFSRVFPLLLWPCVMFLQQLSLALPGPWVLVCPVLCPCDKIPDSCHPLWEFKLCAESSQTPSWTSTFSTKFYLTYLYRLHVFSNIWLLKCVTLS